MAVPKAEKVPAEIEKIQDLEEVLTNEEFDTVFNRPRFDPNAETRTISVSLSKGGVGKTTTAANLAHGLSLQGRKVLLVDTDRQGQCRLILGCNPLLGTAEFSNPRESDRFSLPDVVHLDRNRPLLHFLTGSESLDGWEETAGEISRKDMLNPFRRFEFISECFRQIEKNYDYIVFDTPPGIGLIGYNVLFYAKELMIPVYLSAMTEDSVKSFMDMYDRICRTREKLHDSPLKLKYFLPTFKDETLASRASFDALEKMVDAIRENGTELEHLREVRLLQPIPQTTRIKELPAFGKTIFETYPSSSGAQAYGMLIEEIIKDEQP